MDSWSSTTNPFAGVANPFTEPAKASPLSGDWSKYFANQLATRNSWASEKGNYGYGANFSKGFDYDPGNALGGSYGPMSGMTNKVIDSDINNWLAREHPELFDFTQGVSYGGVAGVGQVAQDPGFGQFNKHPEVYAEIQNAANKYGVPANFLQAIIAKESSGDWDRNNAGPGYQSARGMRIFGYVGVFENAVSSWGFNFDSLVHNRAGQIELLASGLRGMYDKLRKQNPQYGWSNVAAMHYSGDPTMAYTPGDSYQHGTTVQYVTEAVTWWKQLDDKSGNTWSNYTDTSQNKGIGSPTSQQWGQYAEWDQAIVGMSANTGVPANLMKAVLRYGQEHGMDFTGNFDQTFAPVATAIQNGYKQTGDWNKAVTAALHLDPTSFTKVQAYWDELNADMSGVFGGPTGGSRGQVNQMEAIWGGVDYGISQDANETNDWVLSHPGMYDYSYGLLGRLAHPGMDITSPRGTKLYAPANGTVIIAGGTQGYNFYGNSSPQVGQLRIRLDNGDELILGHMMSISVHVGDRVTPGQAVGLSGGAGSGDHLHLEYRTPSNQFSSGWTSVDPKVALGGNFTGYNQGAKTGLGYTQALTFQNLMRAGASGQPIPSGAIYGQGGGRSSWTSWLRQTMQGQTPGSPMAGKVDYASLYNMNPGGIR